MENILLKFIDFRNLDVWDVKRQNFRKNTLKYPSIKLKEILSKTEIEWVDIEDDKEYPILGVRGHGKGVYINRIAKGKELPMKRYQKSKKGLLFYCKVRTVNGQWGIVYPEYENSYGSSNMQYLEVSYDKINPKYFELLLSTKKITSEWDKNAIGADGRHFTLSTLLNLEIPLPTIQEQQEIVDAYFSKIDEAKKLEQEANNIDQEIETYFLNQLGLKDLNYKKKHKGLFSIDFKDLERWDYFSGDYSVISQLKNSVYPLFKLGSIYLFAKRSFNKKTYASPYFKYIEIGAIDPANGILEAKEIKLEKAPSRATQVVRNGDLILGLTRPYLKKFALVTEEYDNNVCSSGFSIIEESDDYHLPYLLQFLKCTYGIEQLKNRMTGGLYPAITEGELKEIKIPLPEIGKQIQIMRLVSKKANEILDSKVVIKNLKHQANEEFEKTIFQ